MLEVLQFIFSSFWVWLGTLILLAAPFNGSTLIRFSKSDHSKGEKP